MIKFLRKFENRCIQIARVNLIIVTKCDYLLSVIYFHFVRFCGPLWSYAIYSAQSIYRDVHVCVHIKIQTAYGLLVSNSLFNSDRIVAVQLRFFLHEIDDFTLACTALIEVDRSTVE